VRSVTRNSAVARGLSLLGFSLGPAALGLHLSLSNIPPPLSLVSPDPSAIFIVISRDAFVRERAGGVWLDVLMIPGPRGAALTWATLRSLGSLQLADGGEGWS